MEIDDLNFEEWKNWTSVIREGERCVPKKGKVKIKRIKKGRLKLKRDVWNLKGKVGTFALFYFWSFVILDSDDGILYPFADDSILVLGANPT